MSCVLYSESPRDFLRDDQQKAIDAIANDYRMKHPDRVRKYSKGFIATQAKDFSDIEGAIVSRTPGGSVKIHTE